MEANEAPAGGRGRRRPAEVEGLRPVRGASGRPLQVVFFTALGFAAADWERLEVELRELALHGTAELGERTSFGQKYLVSGRIEGPGGQAAVVTSVWIVLRQEEVPRLVTVYPEVTR